MYIVVKDSKSNMNLWAIVDEGIDTYEIKSRTSYAYIDKHFCFVKAGSPLLYYQNPNRTIDIAESNIDIEEMSREDNISICKKCLYINGCPDACFKGECRDFYNVDDSSLEQEVLGYQTILNEYNIKLYTEDWK